MLYYGGFSAPAIPPFAYSAPVPPPHEEISLDQDDDVRLPMPVSARLVGSRIVAIDPPADHAVSRHSSITSLGAASYVQQIAAPARQVARFPSASALQRGSVTGRDPIERLPASTQMRAALLRSASARPSVTRTTSHERFTRHTVSSSNRSLSAKSLAPSPTNRLRAEALRDEIAGLKRKIVQLKDDRQTNRETIEVLTQVISDLGRSTAFANSLARSQSRSGRTF
ncbi:hypothetical protein FOL47_004073 [Perkinsus chesapeaki]|uniref:Uncharacterized protein n=1 Tax=Perkinsus chesapeaki TaxID=330153 RepID=A0A7J6M4J7_PERCH|nr:hypothetical protein FOL47_004073 [Perkinsus chesapeaki]